MLAPIIKIPLRLALCLALLSYMGCQKCIEFDNVALVENIKLSHSDADIDSVVMKVNDSIIGCGDHRYRSIVGSKTHNVKFPIDVRIQLFSQGDLWKEFSLEMPKNTVVTVFKEYDCLSLMESPLTFLNRLESAKKQNRFIDSSFVDGYCWLFEKMDSSYDDDSCTELSVSGPQDICYW